jgi:DNA primase
MENALLINKLEKILGKSTPTSRGNHSFRCPVCKHPKPKLEINIQTQQSHCWVCDVKSNQIVSLLRKANIHNDLINDLLPLIPKKSSQTTYTSTQIQLPQEYKPLYEISPKDIMAKHAIKYLKSRGITKNEILKYNIGYCEGGPYSNMIIIPSYDSYGHLNYFIARSFKDNAFIKYKNPPVSKDVIGLESFVNFNVPIILCEGIFDAIAIKRNAIPLFGKTISNELKKKLALSKVDKIYIALDKDAMKQSIKHAKDLLDAGKEVYLVDIEDKDPSQMGFSSFTELISKTPPLTLSSFMEYKLKYTS